MSDIILQKIKKGFGQDEPPVLKEIDLHINSGEFLVLLGPSGCGKTTLLRCIAGLEQTDAGNILIGDRNVNNVPSAKRGLAMVFQSYALYPHMTVRGNIAFGLKLAGLPKDQIDKQVLEVAKTLEISALLNRKPRALSGGQRQRVAIGRAIARQPVAFLFDEPLSNLDAALRVQMRLELAHLHHRLKTTMIYVTHDQMEAMTLADRIVVMRGGVIEQMGKAMELYHRPANRFVAEFIGSPKMNFFPCAGHSAAGNTVNLSLGHDPSRTVRLAYTSAALKPGKIVSMGIRPEHVTASTGSGDGHCRGKISVVEQLGDSTYLYADTDALGVVNLRVQPDLEYRVGDDLNISFNMNACHLFDAVGKSLRSYNNK